MADLLALTADLVGIPSESHDEGAITAFLRSELDATPWLAVEQLGNNLVARTQLGWQPAWSFEDTIRSIYESEVELLSTRRRTTD